MEEMYNSVTLFFLLHISNAKSVSWPSTIKIGLITSNVNPRLFDLTTDETIRDMRSTNLVPKNINFEVAHRVACDDLSSMVTTVDLLKDHDVSVIFGPECSAGMSVTALLAAALNKPIFGFVSITSDLNNKTKYSTLTRTSETMFYMARAVRVLLLQYNWTRISIIRQVDNCDVQLSGVYSEFSANNILIVNNLETDFSSPTSVAYSLNTVKSSSRIVLLCGGNSPYDLLPILKAASQANMMTTDYVYIAPYYRKVTLMDWEPWLINTTSVDDAKELKGFYSNTILIETVAEYSDQFKPFVKRLNQIVASNVSFYGDIWNDDAMLSLAPYRDSLYLYIKLMNDSIMSNKTLSTGLEVFNASAQLYSDFTGVTGRVKIDGNAERVSNYYVSKLNSTGDFVPFLLFGPGEFFFNDTNLQVLHVLDSPNWKTEGNAVPLAVPVCGFRNELCGKTTLPNPTLAISIPIAFSVLLAIIFGSFFGYRRRKFERNLLQMGWKINENLLQYLPKRNVRGSHATSLGSSNLEHVDGQAVTGSVDHVDGCFEEVGVYKESVVAIKRWKRKASVTLQRDHLIHLKNLKELNHDNLNRFIGFSVDSKTFVLCLWVYCDKNSLHEIVFNDEIKLDETFKASIIRDIISGLEYLHASPIGHHGRLFMSNCVVDARWIVKLTDFGLTPVLNEMKRQKTIEFSNEDDFEKLLCTAPEVLRNPQYSDLKPVDIYQLAMIIFQIHYRQEAFADSDLSPIEILHALKAGMFKDAPMRPSFTTTDTKFDGFIKVLSTMLNEYPASRPTIQEVKKQLNNIVKTLLLSKNIIDHVMSMLEKYANNLEKIVDERTAQLKDEQKRADKLLYQMLPKSVADALKSGNNVHPEVFDCVTVYFSDIVGFTVICAKSKPVEIVAMLNSLYSQFDEIIISYDAYKVETIGDAYLVVSGLPIRNGNRHVSIIADMSLKILTVLSKYRIPHLPDVKLQLRIGMHSGSVAGGVVGLTMPKYCLFGDTVNFASRMESTGEAGKIHMTDSAKFLLDKYPDYVVVERGQINVKGKGTCTTYWLMGRNNEVKVAK